MLWMLMGTAWGLGVRVPCASLGDPAVDMFWITRADLVADEAQRAAMELREPKPVSGQWAATFHLSSGDIERARADRYLMVVKDAAGVELARELGDQPMPKWKGSSWTGGAVLYLSTAGQLPLRVYLIDQVQARRCEWEVVAEGTGVRVTEVRAPALPAPPPSPAPVP
jgi:hypothetical protein